MKAERNWGIAGVILLGFAVCLTALPAPTKYSGGSGTTEDPYRIATAADLIALGEDPNDYDKHFILTADIDLDPNLPGRKVFDRAVIGTKIVWETRGASRGAGPTYPVLTILPFAGTFDGNGHTISHLTITGVEYLGLFSRLTAEAVVTRLGIIDANVTGSGSSDPGCYLGVLASHNGGTITQCYSTGSIRGILCVGGLVGNNSGTMSHCRNGGTVAGTRGCMGGLIGINSGEVVHCYNTGTVSGDSLTGGLIGENRGTVTQCYNTGTVCGSYPLGGLTASNSGTVIQCYNVGAVTGTGYDIAGLIATNDGTAVQCYNAGLVSGYGPNVSGLVTSRSSYSSGQEISCFWDTQTSGQRWSQGGFPRTTAEMRDIRTYQDAGWDFVDGNDGASDVWQMIAGIDYPVLAFFNGYTPRALSGKGTPEDPYLIASAADLGVIACHGPSASYRLTASIDFSGTRWGQSVVPWFAGSFDGNNLTISHLALRGLDHVGLFGHVAAGAKIRNLGIVDANLIGIYHDEPSGGYFAAAALRGGGSIPQITGGTTSPQNVGALIGFNQGDVTSCHSSGTISGDTYVGGLIGSNAGAVSYCHSTATVVGAASDIGGLVGSGSGTVSRSYSAGAVAGGVQVGGLAGSGGNFVECYSVAAVIGYSWVGGLVGRNKGSVTRCYSRGPVDSGPPIAGWTPFGQGGLVGANFGSVVKCYSTGAVRRSTSTGGLVAYHSGTTSSVLYSVWDTETSGLSQSDGGIGLTTREMMDPQFLGLYGLANDPNWVLDAGRDYPTLAWEGKPGQMIPSPTVEWLEGSGTADQPYVIRTAEQLIRLTTVPFLRTAHHVLGADIDLDPNLPNRFVFDQAVIPDFQGVLDGDGHCISNLHIKGQTEAGLIGQLRNGAAVNDLRLVDVNITTDGRAGGLVGSSYGRISRCSSTGAVAGDTDTGGLVGYNGGEMMQSHSTATVSGTYYVGGLVGDNSGMVSACHSTGLITGTRYYVGGLAGGNSGTISACCSTGPVTGGEYYVGGLVGEDIRGTISTCYSSGSASGKYYVGGLVGYDEGGTISFCYSTGLVRGAEGYVGGLAMNSRWATITGSFWDVQTSGQTTSFGGIGKTSAEMQMIATFLDAGWDFVGEAKNGTADVWWIEEGKDYPHLVWEIAADANVATAAK